VSSAAERGGDNEDGQADDEHISPSYEVAEPPGEPQQPAECDQVGVHDPGQVGLGEAEVALDRGQRNVHNRHVEDDHQRTCAQHDERNPARAGLVTHRIAPGDRWASIGVTGRRSPS
jgi:hypothetical protein